MARQAKDSKLFVRFYSKSVLNKAKSFGETILDNENRVALKIEGAGRAVHENIDYVTIQIPGDKDCVIDRPAMFCGGSLQDREKAAAAWKEPCRAPQDANGNPRLSECDVHRFIDDWEKYVAGHRQNSTGTPIRDLPGMDDATVDDLAYFKIYTLEQLAGLNDSNATHFFELRQKARDWLAKASPDVQAELKTLREQVAALTANAKPAQAQPKRV